MAQEVVEHHFSLAFKVLDWNVQSKKKRRGKVLNIGGLELPLYLSVCQTAAGELYLLCLVLG